MVKFYKKSYRGSRDKYSIEQTSINANVAAGQTTSVPIVPPIAEQGVRKVKHLTCSFQSPTTTDGCWWALVYVPAGTTPGGINLTTGQPLYEPNQYVMNCGVMDFTAGPTRVSTRISRNLHSGDSIYLLLFPVGSSTSPALAFSGIVRYAVCFN